MKSLLVLLPLTLIIMSCNPGKILEFTVYQTSANGDKLTQKTIFRTSETASSIRILPEQKFQTITGLLNQVLFF